MREYSLIHLHCFTVLDVPVITGVMETSSVFPHLQGHLQTGYYEQLCSLSHNTAKDPQAYALQENHSECRASKKIMLIHLICLKVAIFNNADPSWLLNVAVFSVKNIKWLWIMLSLV